MPFNRRRSRMNPVTWGYNLNENGVSQGDTVRFDDDTWEVTDTKIMVKEGHFFVEVYLQSLTNKAKREVIDSNDTVTLAKSYVAKGGNYFEIEEGNK